MGKITDIKPQAHSRGRVSVYVDGEFVCGLEKLTVLEKRLHVGDEIEPEELEAAVAASETEAAFDRAAKYLGLRPRTEKEMRDYLAGKGYTAAAADSVIAKLASYGYIDDSLFCQSYIEAYKHKSGVRKLKAELTAKGVARYIVDEAIETLDSQSEAVTALAEKYLRSHSPDMRKLTAYLVSRGFDYDTIKEGLRDIELDDEE